MSNRKEYGAVKSKPKFYNNFIIIKDEEWEEHQGSDSDCLSYFSIPEFQKSNGDSEKGIQN